MKIEVIPRLFIISIRAGRNSSSFSRRGNRVTGFLVSFGVWIVQVGVERKRARLQLEKDIASLRETLRYAEIKSNVTMIDSAVISEPNAVKTIISFIKKEPLDIWLESNGRWADFVHILS